MGSTEQFLTMAAMATHSLRRLARLTCASLGAETLAIYVKTDEGRFRRAFSMVNYPQACDEEERLVETLTLEAAAIGRGDHVSVLEDASEHPGLVDHPWIGEAPGWGFVAGARLTPLRPGTPSGYIIVANDEVRCLDEPARAAFIVRLSDWAATFIERIELQKSQAEVAHEMDRMITIGILAAGVAHEINNPLSFVGGNIQFALRLLQEELTSPELPKGTETSVREISEALEDALVGSRRVHDVVKDLHRLAGGSTNDDFTVEQVMVLNPLASSLNIARNHIEQRAKLATDLGDVAPVMGNESKLGQVFLNLLVNAAQAIPRGNVEKNEVRVSTYNRGEDVVVSIRDTGSGIAEADRCHIFEPFFTTKPRNEGTGLGLAISYNIVTTLSGDIEIETAPGEGTTFRVVLPSVAKATRVRTKPK